MEVILEIFLEIIAEIIFEPMLEAYFSVMSYFFHRTKKADKEKVRIVVAVECIALLIMLVIGAIMLFESSGESLTGKVLLIISIPISIIQFSAGLILKIVNKKKNNNSD